MSDPRAEGGIKTKVEPGPAFQTASIGAVPAAKPTPLRIKPEAVADIISNLNEIQNHTDDSRVLKTGSKYALMDNRTHQPLAELNTASNTLTMHKSPEEMAERIGSMWISKKDIEDFLKDIKDDTPARGTKLANASPM